MPSYPAKGTKPSYSQQVAWEGYIRDLETGEFLPGPLAAPIAVAIAEDETIITAATTAAETVVPDIVTADLAGRDLPEVAGDGTLPTAARTDHNHANTGLTGAMHIGPALAAQPAPTLFLAPGESRDGDGAISPTVGAPISTDTDATYGTYWTHNNSTSGNVSFATTGKVSNDAGTLIVDGLFFFNAGGSHAAGGAAQYIGQINNGAGDMVRLGRFAGTGTAPYVAIGNETFQGSGAIADDTWVNLAVTWDDGMVTLYRDGAVVAGPSAYTGNVGAGAPGALMHGLYTACAHAIWYDEALPAEAIERIAATAGDKTWDSVQDGTAASLADNATAVGAGALALAEGSIAIGKGARATTAGVAVIAADVLEPVPVSGGGTGIKLRSPNGTPYLFSPDDTGAWPGSTAPIPTSRTVFLGDSFMGDLGGSTLNSAGRMGVWLLLAGGGRINLLQNSGIPGNTAAQMLARLQTDVIDLAPTFCVVLAGTNDAAAGTSLATYAATMTSILDQLRAAGITPIVGAPAPRAASQALVSAYVAWLGAHCANEGIVFVDTHTPFLDGATGGIKAEYDSDGTHLNQTGLRLMASLLWDAMAPSYRAASLGPAVSNSDASNLLANGLFVTDSNSDGLPDSWVNPSGGTLTPSLASGGTDVAGQWLTLTGTGTATRYVYQQVNSGFAVGDVLLLTGYADIAASSGAQWTVTALCRASTTTIGQAKNAFHRIGIEHPDVAGAFPFATRFVVPATCDNIRILLQVETEAGSARFGQLTLRNLTTMGLV